MKGELTPRASLFHLRPRDGPLTSFTTGKHPSLVVAPDGVEKVTVGNYLVAVRGHLEVGTQEGLQEVFVRSAHRQQQKTKRCCGW